MTDSPMNNVWPEGHKNLGSGHVTRSFFELLDLLRLRGHDEGCGLSIERDTCFVNIVGGE
jgi:hypothetical protein